jgi:hypothetical protein
VRRWLGLWLLRGQVAELENARADVHVRAKAATGWDGTPADLTTRYHTLNWVIETLRHG